MHVRAFVTLSCDRDFFSAVLFEFLRRRMLAACNDEAFVIVHSEPVGDCERHVATFATAEALAEFDRFWREASGPGRVLRALAA